MNRTLSLFASFFLVMAAFLAQPAAAQDASAAPDTVRVEAETVVLVTPDGREVVVVLDPSVEAMRGLRSHVRVHPLPDGGHEDHEARVYRFEADAPRVLRFGDGTAPFDVEVFDRAMDELHPMLDDVGGRVERLRALMPGDMTALLEERREIARLDAESRRLAREVRAAEGDRQERLRGELAEQLAEVYAQKQALREQRLERMAQELAEERRELEQREQAREEIIERRLRELLGEDDVLDW